MCYMQSMLCNAASAAIAVQATRSAFNYTLTQPWRLQNECCSTSIKLPCVDASRLATDYIDMRRPRGCPNLGYYLFSNVRIDNGSVVYYHPAEQPLPADAPTQCATNMPRSLAYSCKCAIACKTSRHTAAHNLPSHAQTLHMAALSASASPDAVSQTSTTWHLLTNIVFQRRYTFWSFTRHDAQIPITYQAVPEGQASPLDTCAHCSLQEEL